MKYAISLSGGGFKGAYQVGAIKALDEAGIIPSFVAGISTGALQGVMWAMMKLRVLAYYWDMVEANGYPEIWDSWIVREKAGELAVKAGGAIEVVLTGELAHRTGLGTLRPLRQKLTESVKLADLRVPCTVGTNSLTTGDYHSIRLNDCQSDLSAVDAVVASATMPFIWEPVPSIQLADGTLIQQGVDGGLSSITPIKECLDYISTQPDNDNWTIVVITCSTSAMDAHPQPYTLLGTVGRSLDILLNKIFMIDLARFDELNRAILESGKTRLIGKRYVPSVIIQPSQNLGSTLDSRTETIRFRRSLGYQDARQQLSTLFS